MPYTADTVPAGVPKEHAAQFAEVWNSVYKAAKDDKMSDSDAEAKAFAQAHSVINKAKKRDVSSDGPGFGPTEKKGEDGGAVSDPQQTLRFNENHDEKGQFTSGGSNDKKPVHEGHHEILKDAGYKQTGDHKGEYKDAEGNKVVVSKNGAFTTTSKTYQMKVGKTADDLKSALGRDLSQISEKRETRAIEYRWE
jgi:hypothetical protein